MSLYIYHERQTTESALCGVHCLNSLLQRPAFTEFELAKIAKDLDDKEREVMASAGDTKEYLKFLSEDSINVGDGKVSFRRKTQSKLDGNFSLQVLQAALHKRNLECVPLTTGNYYTVVCNLSSETAFICNRGSHWFTIRKVLPGEWYNFNSLLDQPQHMPEAHLASYLDDLFDKKDVCIYSIKGNLPNISPENRPSSASGRWIAATGGNKEEFELKIAIEASKMTSGTVSNNNSEAEISYPKLPDFKNEKFNYPALESTPEEQPLAFKSKSKTVTPPVVNTNDLSVHEHLTLVHDYFAKCMSTMEKMDERLTTLEKTFARIQAQK